MLYSSLSFVRCSFNINNSAHYFFTTVLALPYPQTGVENRYLMQLIFLW